jgi:hypothetical protein
VSLLTSRWIGTFEQTRVEFLRLECSRLLRPSHESLRPLSIAKRWTGGNFRFGSDCSRLTRTMGRLKRADSVQEPPEERPESRRKLPFYSEIGVTAQSTHKPQKTVAKGVSAFPLGPCLRFRCLTTREGKTMKIGVSGGTQADWLEDRLHYALGAALSRGSSRGSLKGVHGSAQ